MDGNHMKTPCLALGGVPAKKTDRKPLRLAFGARERGAGRENKQEPPPSRVWGEGGGCQQIKQIENPSDSHLGRGRGMSAERAVLSRFSKDK